MVKSGKLAELVMFRCTLILVQKKVNIFVGFRHKTRLVSTNFGDVRQGSSGFARFAGFRRVLQGFAEYSLGFSGCRRVSQGFAGFLRVSSGFSGFHRVFQGFAGFLRVWPSF